MKNDLLLMFLCQAQCIFGIVHNGGIAVSWGISIPSAGCRCKLMNENYNLNKILIANLSTWNWRTIGEWSWDYFRLPPIAAMRCYASVPFAKHVKKQLCKWQSNRAIENKRKLRIITELSYCPTERSNPAVENWRWKMIYCWCFFVKRNAYSA